MPSPSPSRRRVILTAAASSVVVLAAQMLPRAAQATPQSAAELLQKLTSGTPVPGRIALKAAEVAENGNSVPLTVTVDSPMTDSDHVKAIHLVADGNPNAGIASFFLGPANGKAEVSMRIRLSSSQNVIAVAELSDGRLWSASREVLVTIGGCGG